MKNYILLVLAAFAIGSGLFFSTQSASAVGVAEALKTVAYDDPSIPKKERSGKYGFDKAHSSLGFRIRHLGLVDVPGHFRNFDGSFFYDAENVGKSSIKFTAEVRSVDTGIDARDNHLRSVDFFDVPSFPEMKFESKAVKKKGKSLRVTGDLTLKGITKEVQIPVKLSGPLKDERGQLRMGASGTVEINRRDFGITYGGNLPNGVQVLSDKVVVEIAIEGVKEVGD